ncbi:HTTM domain-containing protein [Natrinema sp. 1APR25-10V2]|uniref:HTTM domain-containing protein n=1 Tax=Natrinema sp. 1APR25-10V2 TaxID=2951081 RepID=UPI002875DE5B|nr:HTTM domain-containing protein [Natrinema sp. 1APR25-10V2]MDS0475024.1 HTTM domain-containing protein [Natrinema sp. 1APR25-10V2]
MSPSDSESTASTRNETTMHTLRAAARSRLGIDPRAIAAFRISLALVVLLDLLVVRAPGITTFYTDDGLFPRSALAETFPRLARWSLHTLSGAAWAQALLFAITALVAVALLVGYRSRLAAFGSALLLASLYARNPYVVNGGDTILVSLLLLAALLPLESRWALGRRPLEHPSPGGDAHEETRVLSAATATVLLHVAIIYALNAALKFRSDAWMDGIAVQRIFQLEDFVHLFGPAIAEHAAVLTAINWLWTAVLSASVLLVLATDRLRTVTAAAFVCAHLSMAATMRLGAFPFVMVTALLLYLPSPVWDRLDRLVSERPLEHRLASVSVGRDSDPEPSFRRRVAPSIQRGTRLITVVFLAVFLLAVVGWQLTAMGFVDDPTSSSDGALEHASWGFFAPNPPDSYSWYVVEAERQSGASIDLVDGEAMDFDRPPNAMDRYPTTLWKRYGTKGQGVGDALLEPAAAYFCERAPDGVESVTIYRLEQPVDATGPAGEPIRHERITTGCG